MEKIIIYSNYFGIVLALCMMVLSGCSCSTTKQDPLAGFHWSSLGNLYSNKTISDDYKDYIQKLSPEERKYTGPIFFYEDGAGQHAVQIEVLVGGKDSWDHYMFYDKNNKRIKAEKIHRGRYWNP